MSKTKKSRLALLKRRFLLLDLSHAKVPGYARIDMETIPFAYFQLHPAEGGWQFGYSNARGEFDALAFFTSEADAKAVLARVGAAYMNPHPLFGFAVRVAIVCGVFWCSLFAFNWLLEVTKPVPAQPTAMPIQAPPQPEGVPFDADSKLTVPK